MTEPKGAYPLRGTELSTATSNRYPWWCRTFGHRFVSRPRVRINDTRWEQPTVIPLDTYCSRCGTAPEPAAGGCTATGEGILDRAPFTCDMREGHSGSHHDAATDADWWKRP